MTDQFTPGPLVAYKTGAGPFAVAPQGEDGQPVDAFATATCHVQHFHPGGLDAAMREAHANALLYAAAPRLVAALEAIVRITDGSQPLDYPGALMVARDALAFVRGSR